MANGGADREQEHFWKGGLVSGARGRSGNCLYPCQPGAARRNKGARAEKLGQAWMVWAVLAESRCSRRSGDAGAIAKCGQGVEEGAQGLRAGQSLKRDEPASLP